MDDTTVTNLEVLVAIRAHMEGALQTKCFVRTTIADASMRPDIDNVIKRLNSWNQAPTYTGAANDTSKVSAQTPLLTAESIDASARQTLLLLDELLDHFQKLVGVEGVVRALQPPESELSARAPTVIPVERREADRDKPPTDSALVVIPWGKHIGILVRNFLVSTTHGWPHTICFSSDPTGHVPISRISKSLTAHIIELMDIHSLTSVIATVPTVTPETIEAIPLRKIVLLFKDDLIAGTDTLSEIDLVRRCVDWIQLPHVIPSRII